MRTVKKVIYILSVLVLTSMCLFGGFVYAVSATAVVAVQSEPVYRGREFDVTVKYSGAGLSGVEAVLTYDQSKIEYVGGDNSNGGGGTVTLAAVTAAAGGQSSMSFSVRFRAGLNGACKLSLKTQSTLDYAEKSMGKPSASATVNILSASADPAALPTCGVRVLGEDAYIFAGADLNNVIKCGLLRSGTAVSVTGETGGLYKLTHNGRTCYAKKAAFDLPYTHIKLKAAAPLLASPGGAEAATGAAGDIFEVQSYKDADGYIMLSLADGSTAYLANTADMQKMTSAEANGRAIGAYNITVKLPSGYSGIKTLYVDGIGYEGTLSGSTLKVTVYTSRAKTATMYLKNASGVAVGMYVWLLSYSGGYKATPEPALQDILTYHGFSIRVTGYTGIRFRTGISESVKKALTSPNGYNGYKLTEYGTVAMRAANLGVLPFVTGGVKTSYGKAYYTENGKLYDIVFETVSGRQRFTTVLKNISEADYKSDFAFRGVIKLSKGLSQYTVYGPPVGRSIYTVAGQIIAAGEFKVGTSQYNFVKNIRDVGDRQG